jgi:hypothetical protein
MKTQSFGLTPHPDPFDGAQDRLPPQGGKELLIAAVSRLLAVMCLLLIGGAVSPALAACAGDCDGDGQVTVNELIVGIRVALGSASLDECTSIDADGDRNVTIGEIIAAVNVALDGCPPQGRLLALSRGGRIASLEIAAPWRVRATGDLGLTIASARCRGGRCLVVHPAPADRISVVAAADLSTVNPYALEHGADPRDVALVDDHTAVVSQYGRPLLLEIDLSTRSITPIDVSVLADADGVPEALKMASCGRRVFVQLRRIDQDSGVPSPLGGALAVIDLDRPTGEEVVDADPATPGVQGIALAGRPNFDMPVDCDAGVLYVAEPEPLMQGGGGYERVDLATLTASDFPADTGAEVGGFEVVGPEVYWLITHTEFGPGPSSHLNLVGGSVPDTHNTFAEEHVNDLALDREEDLLFYPDPCFPGPVGCDAGVIVFHAHTGERASAEAIDVGFPPIEVTVSR